LVSIADPLLSRPEPRRRPIQAWRRRSRVIIALRVLFPTLIGVILLGLGASVGWNTLTGQNLQAGSPNDPIRLVNPRFVGRDTRSRAFVLTAATATRDPNDINKVYLDGPALIIDEEGPDPLRITAKTGVYHEDTGKLQVAGGVRLSGARGAFETAESLFDTKTHELTGSGPVHGLGGVGEITAKSYGVYDQGEHMVFRGGVHTILNVKK
jgi:lipopolysaccharide export system protein LptC